MTDKSKRIMIIGLLLVVWFVIADAYWMSKKRSVARCTIEASTDLIKHTTDKWYFRHEGWDDGGGEYFNAARMVRDHCSWTEGAGNDWDSFRGLAYWEAILTLPVVYRYTSN